MSICVDSSHTTRFWQTPHHWPVGVVGRCLNLQIMTVSRFTSAIDNRGEGWTGNARTVRVPVCIDHPILYINYGIFGKYSIAFYVIIQLEHFSP